MWLFLCASAASAAFVAVVVVVVVGVDVNFGCVLFVAVELAVEFPVDNFVSGAGTGTDAGAAF